jgi:tetratricopeptide (TPR) repeat protein
MQCPKCGAEIDVSFASECPRCGVVFAKLSRPAPPPKSTATTSKRKDNRAALPWIIGTLVAIAMFIPRFISTSDGWYHDSVGYEQAISEHQRTHNPVLVYFYTDWCPHCRELERNVFSSPDFREHFASLIKVKINPESGHREHGLGKQFHIAGYPSLFVIDSESKPRRVPRYKDRHDFFAAIEGQYVGDAIQRGFSFLDRGKAVQAGGEFDRAILLNPNDPEPHYWKGCALLDSGRRVEAKYEFQTAIRLGPHAPSYDNLAWLAVDKRDWGEALDYATKLIAINPRYEQGRGYYLRAYAYSGMGKTFEAYQDAASACELGNKEACKMRDQLSQRAPQQQ